MSMIADILLVAAALGATFYCIVLSRRLSRFTDLEKGVGGAIAVLSAQVDDMTRTLQSAQGAASASANSLGDLTGRAEGAARKLELLVASMHDLPGLETARPAPQPAPPPPAPAPRAVDPAPEPLVLKVKDEDDADAPFKPVPITGLFSTSRAGAA